MRFILFSTMSIVVATIVAGLYGILHDQITYSISHEYYTHFKFIQFQLAEPIADRNGIEQVKILNPRLGTCVVGFLATWWLGPPLGLILGIACLLRRQDFKIFMFALVRVIGIAAISGAIGGLGGWCFGNPNQAYPKDLSFQVVGSIHNFSYLGAAVGIIIAILYIQRSSQKTKSV